MDAPRTENTIATETRIETGAETVSVSAAAEARAEPAFEPKAEAPPRAEPSSPSIEVPLAASPIGWRAAILGKAAALRANPMALLAASVLLAGACGTIIGAVAATQVGSTPQSAEATRVLPGADVRALIASVAQLKADIAALKTANDTANRNIGVQVTRINERVERIDKGQAEPAAKLARVAETVDRLDQRTTTTAATSTVAKDVTGSVAPRQAPAVVPAGAAPRLAAAPPEPPKPIILEGWRVRSVYDGAALLQGRNGLIEVEPGDTLPGGGRIERIGRQDGRWVVVTSKGLITSLR